MGLFEPLFRSLNETGVRYVVVGGVATVLHGHARLTADVDLIVDLEPSRARRLVAKLSELGFVPRAPVDSLDFADPSIRQRWIDEKGMQVFSMIDRSNPMRVVDLFVNHPIDFETLWARARIIDLETTTVRIASIPDLIRLKRLAGRPQDVEDIDGWNASREGTPMSRHQGPREGIWPVTWEASHAAMLDSVASATPAQRLAWLEEAIRLAYRSGALPIDVPEAGSQEPGARR